MSVLAEVCAGQVQLPWELEVCSDVTQGAV